MVILPGVYSNENWNHLLTQKNVITVLFQNGEKIGI